MTCEALRESLRSKGVKEEQLPSCPKSGSENGGPSAPGACSCVKGVYTCSYTLADFRVSYFTHPNMATLSKQIANDIEAHRADRVKFIQIKGYADGTSDANGAGHWEKVPEICRKKSLSDIFYDKDLARVRACMLHYSLQATTKLTLDLLARDISLADLKDKDYRTSREYADGKYRKVEVAFTVEGMCQ